MLNRPVLAASVPATVGARPVEVRRAGSTRKYVLLAPSEANFIPFTKLSVNPVQHQSLLGELQRVRGQIYLEDGAIGPDRLTWDGRFVQAADAKSWHLLILNDKGRVAGCARYRPHHSLVTFDELSVRDSALAKSSEWGPTLRRAVEAEITRARNRGLHYAELGGWALTEELRFSSEAMKVGILMYGLGQLLGGAIGVTTATTRHHSSSILRRFGGESLTSNGKELPPYYDSQYQCEMELLRFDSARPSPKYAAMVEAARQQLADVLVVSPAMTTDSWTNSLFSLQNSLAHNRVVTEGLYSEAS
ncbi:MAG TPA: hypothetical protein VE621_12935 [Bryobacteraceae bacterium]|nr:hypothetical protein [Bryobacteraceae bacterium]